jgi:endonuclease YncB( thermonuclease family)
MPSSQYRPFAWHRSTRLKRVKRSAKRSKHHLADLCRERHVEVRRQTTDRYGRMVARVSCAGMYASAEQVRTGMAWAYLEYVTDPVIKELERDARGHGHGRGLWSDAAPVAPWIWRRPEKL